MRAILLLPILLVLALAPPAAAPPPRLEPAYDEAEALLAYQYAKIAVCDLGDILAFNCSACGNRTAGFFTSWAVESDRCDCAACSGIQDGILVSYYETGTTCRCSWGLTRRAT
jgi:hypothetical protein